MRQYAAETIPNPKKVYLAETFISKCKLPNSIVLQSSTKRYKLRNMVMKTQHNIVYNIR